MRWGQVGIALFCGIIVGLGVPLVTQKVPFRVPAIKQVGIFGEQEINNPTQTALTQPAPTQTAPIYRFILADGKLSVVKKESNGSEQIIAGGLTTSMWPADVLEMVPQVQFSSLDEVQSFIDSTSELIREE